MDAAPRWRVSISPDVRSVVVDASGLRLIVGRQASITSECGRLTAVSRPFESQVGSSRAVAIDFVVQAVVADRCGNPLWMTIKTAQGT